MQQEYQFLTYNPSFLEMASENSFQMQPQLLPEPEPEHINYPKHAKKKSKRKREVCTLLILRCVAARAIFVIEVSQIYLYNR